MKLCKAAQSFLFVIWCKCKQWILISHQLTLSMEAIYYPLHIITTCPCFFFSVWISQIQFTIITQYVQYNTKNLQNLLGWCIKKLKCNSHFWLQIYVMCNCNLWGKSVTRFNANNDWQCLNLLNSAGLGAMRMMGIVVCTWWSVRHSWHQPHCPLSAACCATILLL